MGTVAVLSSLSSSFFPLSFAKLMPVSALQKKSLNGNRMRCYPSRWQRTKQRQVKWTTWKQISLSSVSLWSVSFCFPISGLNKLYPVLSLWKKKNADLQDAKNTTKTHKTKPSKETKNIHITGKKTAEHSQRQVDNLRVGKSLLTAMW